MTLQLQPSSPSWSKVRLSDLGFTYGGLAGKSARDFGTGEGLYVPFTNVIQNVSLDPSNLERVRIRPGETQNSISGGDLLLNASSETPDEVGMACYVDDELDLSDVYLNSFCFGFRVTAPKRVCSKFLAYQLRGPVGRTLMAPLAQGFTRYNLSKNRFLALEIPIPPIDEQIAIATALRDVDSLMDSLDELIAKKRDLKAATAHALLSGEVRLPGFIEEWKPTRVGGLGSFIKGGGISKSDIVGSGVPCVLYGEIYTRHHDWIREFHSHIPPELTTKATELKDGDILFTGSGETAEDIGKSVAFLGGEQAYAGGDIVILRGTGQDPMFFGYALNSRAVNSQKARLGQGATVIHINSSHLAELTLSLPPIEEQKAIRNILADIDTEIFALVARREKTALLKHGMMQELLTGRTRRVA